MDKNNNNEIIVKFDEVTKKYGDLVVLDKLNLEIKKNEFDKLYIDDQVLEIFIAILHLREADIDLEEMEKLIEIANDFYPIPLPIRNPGRVNLN